MMSHIPLGALEQGAAITLLNQRDIPNLVRDILYIRYTPTRSVRRGLQHVKVVEEAFAFGSKVKVTDTLGW